MRPVTSLGDPDEKRRTEMYVGGLLKALQERELRAASVNKDEALKVADWSQLSLSPTATNVNVIA